LANYERGWRRDPGLGVACAVLERDPQQLKAFGGVSKLAGLSHAIKRQPYRTGTTGEIVGAEKIFVVTTTRGVSARCALCRVMLAPGSAS